MKRKVLKYLTRWPDVPGDTYKIALKPEPRIIPPESGNVPCRETLREVEYRLEKVYMHNEPCFVWAVADVADDIEVVDNRLEHLPIAFMSA
jgi:hypothetical protein